MTLARAVLATLWYSDYFSFPLTLSELHSRLIVSKPTSLPLLSRTVDSLLKSGQLSRTGKYYHLPGSSALVPKRLQRQRLSARLLPHAQAYATRLGRLPGVLAIYLTGSLAMQNSTTSSDIDFLVITKTGRLWSTRLFLTLYTEFFRLRRHPNSSSHAISGLLCLNLYLTPTSLSLPPPKRTLYTAYELIQVVPLFDPFTIHPLLLAANPWLHTYLANFAAPQPKTTVSNFSSPPHVFQTLFELFAYHLQLWYMRKKITRELVTPNLAFFHPHNPGQVVLKRLKNL